MEKPETPPPDSWTDPIGTSANYSDIRRASQRTVRLVISIPVLTLLIVLGWGSLIFVYLNREAEKPILSQTTTANIERRMGPGTELENVRRELNNARSRFDQLGSTILLHSILVSLLAGVIGYVLALQIVRPIREMTKTMEALAEGDFSTKLKPISLGEFGELGVTFNRMVEQLNKLFEERDRQLRRSFAGAHLLLDKKGVILQVDQSAGRLFGENPALLMGKSLMDAGEEIPLIRQNPRLLQTLVNLLPEAVAGRPASRPVSVRRDGSTTQLLVSCLQLEGSDAGEPKVLLEVRDISGISSFYEQIQRADRLAAVGTLATGIAHEIRNPLASIRGMAQLLAESNEGDDRERAARYLPRMLKEVDRLEKLISGIMDFAQSTDTSAEDININDLLQDMCESARLHVGEEALKAQIVWELDQSLPDATVQPERLRQALLNLLVNAFQHCVDNEVGPVRIQTLYLPVNPQRPVIICISNPCETIDEQTRERLFEPFYTTKAEGTGLGLPIAYQSIVSNGGILEVECEGGEIQFWIRLPKGISGRGGSSSRIFPRMFTTPRPITETEG